MKIDARRVTDDLFPSLRLVGRPKTNSAPRAEQLRKNQAAYRARKKLAKTQNNYDNALSKLGGFSLIEMIQVLGLISIFSLGTLQTFEDLEPEVQKLANQQKQQICQYRKFKGCD